MIFDRTNSSNKNKILNDIFLNYKVIINNEISLRALCSILDEELDPSSELIIINYFSKIPFKNLLNETSLKVIEPIVGYKTKSNFIDKLVLNHFKELIDLRQGYFLLKKYCKETKDKEIQVEIVNRLMSLPLSYFKEINPCLLTECILLNFQLDEFKGVNNQKEPLFLKDYYYKKYYLNKDDNIIISLKDEFKINKNNKNNYNTQDYFKKKIILKNHSLFNKKFVISKNTKALEKLFNFVITSIFLLKINTFTSKLISSIILYGGLIFEKRFFKKLKHDNHHDYLSSLFTNVNFGLKIISYCRRYFSDTGKRDLENYLSNFIVSKSKMSIYSLSQIKESNSNYDEDLCKYIKIHNYFNNFKQNVKPSNVSPPKNHSFSKQNKFIKETNNINKAEIKDIFIDNKTNYNMLYNNIMNNNINNNLCNTIKNNSFPFNTSYNQIMNNNSILSNITSNSNYSLIPYNPINTYYNSNIYNYIPNNQNIPQNYNNQNNRTNFPQNNLITNSDLIHNNNSNMIFQNNNQFTHQPLYHNHNNITNRYNMINEAHFTRQNIPLNPNYLNANLINSNISTNNHIYPNNQLHQNNNIQMGINNLYYNNNTFSNTNNNP